MSATNMVMTIKYLSHKYWFTLLKLPTQSTLERRHTRGDTWLLACSDIQKVQQQLTAGNRAVTKDCLQCLKKKKRH